MGNLKTLSNTLLRSRSNGNGRHKKNGNGNGGKPAHSGKFHFEALEPRLLLSSDLTYAGTAAFDLTLRYDESSQKLQLIDNATSAAVVEQNLSDTSAVRIQGSSESDRLTVDFSSLFEVSGGIIFDDSGSGDSDTLQINGKPATNWNISGPNSGSADGNIQFNQVENLRGSADNQDTFFVNAASELSGVIDGGAGGFDTLVLDGGNFTSMVFSATGPDAGTIARDGNILTYAGLEPITMTGIVNDLVLNATSGSDSVRLADSGSGYILECIGTPTFESINFNAPLNSLTVNLGAGNDTLTIDELNLGACLTVNDGAGTDSVTIAGNLALPGMDLTINAETITVNENVQVSTHNTAGSTYGDITLRAAAAGTGQILGTDINTNAAAAVTIASGAEITGGDITLDATATININSQAMDLFGGAVKIGAVQATAAPSVTVQGATINASGDLTLSATSNVTTVVTAAPDSSSSNTSTDAAVATSLVSSSANVLVSGTLTASGAALVSAVNNVSVTTTADGSAGDNSSGAAGATVGAAIVSGDTTAEFSGGALNAASVEIKASSTRSVTTVAKGTEGGAESGAGSNTSEERLADPNQDGDNKDRAQTGDSNLDFAAAVAVSIVTGDTNAEVSGGTITTAGQVAVISSANTDSAALADASNNQSGTSVGAAAAINVASVNNIAEITGGSVMGNGVTVAARMTDVAAETADTYSFSAAAKSGAGSSSGTGVAGSLAVNVGVTDTQARITGGSVTVNAGGLHLEATNTTDNKAEATPLLDGATAKSLGVGASVAVNVADNITRSAIENGVTLPSMNGGVQLTATSSDTVTTTAKGGAKGGTAVSPVVAVAVVIDDTKAELGTGNTLTTIGAGSDVALTADHSGGIVTTAEGAAEGTDAAVGAAVAITYAGDNTLATTARAINAGGNVAFTAQSNVSSSSSAKASAKGGKKNTDATSSNEQTDGQTKAQRGVANTAANANNARNSGDTATTPTSTVADTSGGGGSSSSVSVAGAVAVDVANSTTKATIPDSGNVTAGGDIALTSRANIDSKADASGEAVGGDADVGVGAAVAINVSTVTNEASIGQNATITARGATLQAGMRDLSSEATDTHESSATAKSGAGSKDVGVAGAVAINVANSSTTAAIGSSANITLSGGGLTLQALSATSDTAEATPIEDGGSGSDVGIGASVAVNSTDHNATAEIKDNAGLLGTPSNLSITATGTHAATTEAQNGAKGDVGVGVAAAVTVTRNDTTARLGSGSAPLTLTGSALIKASHENTVTGTAGAKASGANAAVGASVVVNVVTDHAKAEAGRDFTANGTATIESDSTISATAQATASAGGGKSGGRTADQEASNQVGSNQTNGAAMPADANAGTQAGSASSTADSESSTGSNGVGVAAAVSINVITGDNQALISNGADVTAGGAVLVSAKGTVDGKAQSDSTAVDLGDTNVSIGAAVALNFASVDNNAIVATGSDIHGNGVVIEAVTTGSERNDFTATAFSAAGNKGDVGIAGVAAINVVDIDTQAMIGDGASLVSTGTTAITAEETLGVQAAAVSGGFSQGTAVGAATAVNVIGTGTGGMFTRASIGDPDASGTGAAVTATGQAITVQATQTVSQGSTLDLPNSINTAGINDPATSLTSLAIAGGGSSGNAGVAGSVAVNVFETSTQALVDRTAVVNAGSLALSAQDTTNLTSAAGSIGIGIDGAGVGAGLDLSVISKDTRAFVGQGAAVTTSGDVSVSADSADHILSIAANAGIGNSAGVAGSASVQVITEATRAYLEGSAPGTTATTINATGDVSLAADGTLEATMIAGSIGAGSSAGIGAANTTLVHTDTVEAYAGERSSVTTRGDAGLSITADSSEDLITIAAAGGGASSAAVAGSAVVNDLNETTNAYIGKNANVTAQSAINNPGILVDASDDTTIVSVAGSLAASGSVAVGVGADVGIITKNTRAYIDSGAGTVAGGGIIDADGDIKVNAQSSEDITSVAAGMGASGSAAVTLDASVHILTATTKAFIGDEDGIGSAGPGHVHAQGDVVIAADDKTEMDKIVGVLAVAGSAGVGAAGAVTVTDKTTEAFIGNGAWVTGEGNSTGQSVKTGAFTLNGGSSATFDPRAASGEGVQTNSISGTPDMNTLQGQGEVKLPSLNAMDVNKDGTNDLRIGSLSRDAASQSGFHGVAVTATNQDDIESFSMSVAGGTAGVAIAANVNVIDTATTAFIGENAKVNEIQSGANSAQSVLISAGSDFQHVAIAGTLGVGEVGVSPAADVTVLSNTTRASVGTGAVVKAKDDISVGSHGREDFLLAGFGIGGGVVGIGGAVNVLTVDNTTSATIGANADLDAGGDVVVKATDDTRVDVISGALAGGLVGVGGSVGVLSITKDTQAVVSNGASVDALGNGTGVAGVLDGTMIGDGDGFGNATVHGVIVQAQSSEDILQITAAAGAGYVGVSGGVGVTLIDSDTAAVIGNAQINQTGGNTGANALQSVYVDASNDARVKSFAGAGAGGVVGVSGAVNVGSVKNDTSAQIQTGAQVDAKKDVEVNALGIKDIDTYAVSGSVGLVGLTASVSVWSVGTTIQKNYSDNSGAPSQNAVAGNGGATADSDAARQAGDAQTSVGSMLSGFTAGNTVDSKESSTERIHSGTGNAATRLGTDGPSQSDITGSIDSAATSTGTEAFIAAGATVTAGHNIEVTANEDLEVDNIVGTAAAGFVGAGAAVDVTNLAVNANAHADGTLSAGNEINVASLLDEDVSVNSISGSTGFVGLGAAVVVINDSSATSASLSGAATKAVSIDVSADSTRNLTANTAQAQVGAGATGASFTRLTVNGDTTASVGTGTQIGQSAGSTVGTLNVTADANIDAHAQTRALSAGAVAVNANFAFVDINPDVTASIDNSANIKLTGNAVVQADGEVNANAEVLSASGGLAATGASIGQANITSTVTAKAGDSAVVNTSGDITLESLFNHNGTAATGKKAQATANASSLAVGASGSGTTTIAHNSGDSEATTGIGSSLSGHNVNISALSSNVAITDNKTLSLGLGAAIGLSSSTATADGTTMADVEGAVTGTGSVTIRTDATNTATATAEAPSAGLGASGVGAKTVAESIQTVESKVGGSSSIGANGAIDITAISNSTATADSNALSIGLAVGMGASVANATANGTTKSHMDGAITGGTSLTIAATGYSDADATADASGGGLVSATLPLASATASPTVNAYKDGTGNVTVSGSVSLTAASNSDADATASGLNFGAASLGVMQASATVSPTVDTHLNGGTITAGSISLLSKHNHDTINPLSSHGATAIADAAGGGIFNGKGAVPTANANADVNASVNGGTLHATGGITINAYASNVANADANALSVGAYTLGASIANATANGTTKAHLGGTVTGGTGLTIAATGYSDADATADASGGGLVSGNKPLASATASPTVKAYKDGLGNVTVSGNISLASASNSDADATASGFSLGLGGAVGVMQATATNSPLLETYITGGTITANGGSITLLSTQNHDTVNPLSGHGASSIADATGGGLFDSGQGAVPTAMANADVNTYVGSGTTLDADSAISIKSYGSNVAYADANVLSIGGVLSIGASLPTATANGTTKAHMDGAVTGGSSLTIAASGVSDADAAADSSGGGLISAALPLASATASPTVKAYKTGSGSVSVSGTMSLTATSEADADAEASSLNFGAASLGVMQATAAVSPVVNTYIDGGTITAGSISLLSKHNHDTINPLSSHGATAIADAAGAGIFDGKGAIPTANANAIVDTYIGTGATLNAGTGSITIKSFSSNIASATADADGGGFLGIGASIANATASGSTKARMDGSVHGASTAYLDSGAGSLTLLSKAINSADAKAEASSGGLMNITLPSAKATASPTVETRIGNDTTGAFVRVNGAVTAQSIVETNAVANAPAFTVGLALGVGITEPTATIAPNIDTFIGNYSSVYAGSITVESLHNYDTNGSVVNATFLLGDSYVTDAKGAHARANASGGGLIGYNSATSTATANADVQSAIKGTTISAGNDVKVRTLSNNDADAKSTGNTIGMIGIGTVSATSTANGTTKAYVSGVSSLQGNHLAVLAKGTNDAEAFTHSAVGGLISGRESLSNASAGPTVEAYATSASNGNINATDAASITALAVGDATSTAEGDSGGIGAFGKSKAVAAWTPNVDAYVGPQTTLTAGGNVLVQAFNNYDFNESTLTGTKNTSKLTEANAKSSVGALIGVTGSEASVTVNSNVDATVKAGASMTSIGGNVTLTADSRNNAKSKADGKAYGAIGLGIGTSIASTTLNNGTHATTEDGSASDRTELYAGGNAFIHSNSDNVVDVDAIGAGAELAAAEINEATATASVQSDTITSSIGSYNDITAGALMELTAVRIADVQAYALLDGGFNVVNVDDAKATATIANAPTTVSIGSYTNVNANRVSMTADDKDVYASAEARTETSATIYANFHPTATVNIDVSSNASIGTGAQITATDSMSVLATETGAADTDPGVRTRSYAYGKVGAGAVSNLIATANNTRNSAANVTAEPTALITTKTLTVEAKGSQSTSTDRTDTNAETDAATVSKFIQTGVKTVCTIVGEVVCVWGLICDPEQVCETVVEGFFEVIGAADKEVEHRTDNASNSINFNADIHITGGGNPIVEIDASGRVVQDSKVTVRDGNGTVIGIGGTVTTSSIYLDDILNDDPPGSIVMRATSGSTSGASNIQFDAAFDTVQVINRSNKNLFLDKIEVFNTGTPPTITHVADTANKAWNYNLSTNATTSDITITNDSAADTDITLQDRILNPGGRTTIRNIGLGGGDILKSGSAEAYIASRVVSLISESGWVGDAVNRILVGLTVSGDGTGYT